LRRQFPFSQQVKLELPDLLRSQPIGRTRW
jgi:hypothetical protein